MLNRSQDASIYPSIMEKIINPMISSTRIAVIIDDVLFKSFLDSFSPTALNLYPQKHSSADTGFTSLQSGQIFLCFSFARSNQFTAGTL